MILASKTCISIHQANDSENKSLSIKNHQVEVKTVIKIQNVH